MGIPISDTINKDAVRDRLLQAHSILIKASTEQEIVATIGMFVDHTATLRMYHLDLDEHGQPGAVRVVVSWRDGGPWAADPLLGQTMPIRQSSLAQVVLSQPDPLYFASDIEDCIADALRPGMDSVRALIAMKLYGVAHVEQPAQWHGFICISWSEVHAFMPEERYFYVSLWETASIAISNLRLRQDALENLRRLKELDQLKSAFLHGVSHELRTPLTSFITITGGILAGMDGPLNDELELDIALIQESSGHLLHVINDLLDMASIEANKICLTLEPVDMDSVILEAVQTIEPLARQKGLTIQVDVEQNLPLVCADRNRILQVLLNLLSNAVKFSEQGSILVTFEVGERELMVHVHDEGIGIDPANLARIFERFHRVDSPTARLAGGTGLGLPISRRLMELHHGKLTVESRLGHGSTFTFSLPLWRSADENPVC